jgi:hypothetical protein
MEGKDSTHKVKYSKSNDTYQVWLGDEIVTDFATEEKANAEAKRLNALQDAKRVDKAQMEEDRFRSSRQRTTHAKSRPISYWKIRYGIIPNGRWI